MRQKETQALLTLGHRIQENAQLPSCALLFKPDLPGKRSDGRAVLIQIRIVLGIASRKEQAQHTHNEHRGNGDDQPHRMARQPHNHEERDNRDGDQRPAAHAEPLTQPKNSSAG